MMDLAEFTWGRYNGGQVVPTGSYVELRTLAYVQSTSDQTLPQDGIFFRVGTAGNESAATLATTLNGVLGTSYTGSSLHSATGADNVPQPGTGANDA